MIWRHSYNCKECQVTNWFSLCLQRLSFIPENSGPHYTIGLMPLQRHDCFTCLWIPHLPYLLLHLQHLAHAWCISTQKYCLMIGTSPVVQGLRLCLPTQGTKVRSLVRELRSHMLSGVVKKKKPNDSYLHLLFKGKKGDKENKEKQANLLHWMVTNLWWVCVWHNGLSCLQRVLRASINFSVLEAASHPSPHHMVKLVRWRPQTSGLPLKQQAACSWQPFNS